MAQDVHQAPELRSKDRYHALKDKMAEEENGLRYATVSLVLATPIFGLRLYHAVVGKLTSFNYQYNDGRDIEGFLVSDWQAASRLFVKPRCDNQCEIPFLCNFGSCRWAQFRRRRCSGALTEVAGLVSGVWRRFYQRRDGYYVMATSSVQYLDIFAQYLVISQENVACLKGTTSRRRAQSRTAIQGRLGHDDINTWLEPSGVCERLSRDFISMRVGFVSCHLKSVTGIMCQGCFVPMTKMKDGHVTNDYGCCQHHDTICTPTALPI